MNTQTENTDNHFLQVIDHLRTNEQVLIHAGTYSTSEEADEDVINYLEREYENERLGYPVNSPDFEPSAALWGAKTLYVASHLLLNRNEMPKDLPDLLPAFAGQEQPETILSADLCLRFLPAIVQQAKAIDPEDELITLLEIHLQQWHYSAIGYWSNLSPLKLELIIEDECMLQLYVDRVIERKARVFVENELLEQRIKGSLGIYQKNFWPEL